MLTINKNEIPIIGQLENAGINKNFDSFLSMLSISSIEYIKFILQPKQSLKIEKDIIRTIVHKDPHLDEYFAELLFRSCLSDNMSNLEFVEQAIYSKDDFGCDQLWPKAAVFGFGDTPLVRKKPPLVLFDEHREGIEKSTTCSQIVIDYMKDNRQIGKEFSPSIWKVLNEVNAIDMHGNAHSQHLGNMIKSIHGIRFLFRKGNTEEEDVRDFLSPIWKRSLIDACIVAIIYCLENNIDIVGEPIEKKKELMASLEEYKARCLHKDRTDYFDDTFQGIKTMYGNQTKVFQEALLKEGTELIRDKFGNSLSQILVMSRICFACNQCWGKNISNIIMTHVWEVEFQKQTNFLMLLNELEKTFSYSDRGITPLGTIRRKILHTVKINKVRKDYKFDRIGTVEAKLPLWVINIRPILGVSTPNKAALNYINKHNDGCGIVLIEDTYIGTKTLFKGQGILTKDWENLIDTIDEIEPGYWYHTEGSNWCLNGNMSHREVPHSMLDMAILCKLAEDNMEKVY